MIYFQQQITTQQIQVNLLFHCGKTMWILILMLLLAPAVFASETASDSVKYRIPEQTITGSRVEKPWIENMTAITALRAAEQPSIRGLGLTDNLLLIPGLVSLSRFGTDDIRLSMRGMGARSNSGVRGVRVLYDGIPESEPDGQTRLEGIEAGNLDRIEVLRGGGSALYGNAAAGVVNLRTAESFPRGGVRFEAAGGGFGYYRTRLAVGSGPDLTRAGGTLAVSQVKTDGWREHSAYEAQILSGSLRMLTTERSKMRALLYINNTSAQIPGPLTREEFAADPDQAQQRYVDRNVRRYTRKGRLGLQYTQALARNVELSLTPFAALKKLDRPRENNQYQLITRYILGTNAQLEWATRLGASEAELIGGLDQQFQDGPVTWYAMQNGNRTSELLSQEQERQWGQGYFVQWEMENKIWGGLLGLRYDHIQLSDDIYTAVAADTRYDKTALTPRAGFRYHLHRDWVVFASAYGGFETPALSETENPFGYAVKPQRTLTTEAGLRLSRGEAESHLDLEATAYRMAISDAIVPDSGVDPADSSSIVNFYSNAGSAVHQGIEFSLKWTRERLGFVGIAASFGQFQFTDYVSRLGQDFANKKVAGISPDMLNVIVRWTPAKVIFAELNVRNYGAAYANSANTEKAEGWTTLGAAIGGQLPLHALSASWQLGAVNLTDKKYVSFIQVNDGNGRYYESGMPFTLFGGITLATPGL